MTAVTRTERALAVGDRVFVHREEERAPLHLRGLAGAVVLTEGSKAFVQLGDCEPHWVELDILRIDRRRKRRPVKWASEPGAQSSSPRTEDAEK